MKARKNIHMIKYVSLAVTAALVLLFSTGCAAVRLAENPGVPGGFFDIAREGKAMNDTAEAGRYETAGAEPYETTEVEPYETKETEPYETTESGKNVSGFIDDGKPHYDALDVLLGTYDPTVSYSEEEINVNLIWQECAAMCVEGRTRSDIISSWGEPNIYYTGNKALYRAASRGLTVAILFTDGGDMESLCIIGDEELNELIRPNAD